MNKLSINDYKRKKVLNINENIINIEGITVFEIINDLAKPCSISI